MVVLEKTVCLCLENSFNCGQHLIKNCRSNPNLTQNLKSKEILAKKLLAELLFDICKDCSEMAAIPQGAFAACKLRENFRERETLSSCMKSENSSNDSNFTNEKPEPKLFMSHKKPLEYAPVKYNSKLMNSIWGFYNRYSPHNIKSNDDVNQTYFLQQPNAVAGIALDVSSAMDCAKEWGFMDK